MSDTRRTLLRSIGATLFLLSAAAAQAATFTVNTTNDLDDGACNAAHCSLREAIAAANTAAGPDTIAFNIPGTGVRQILLTSVLPVITSAVTIDGYTQPGAAANTNATGALNTVLLIEIRGAPGISRGFLILIQTAGTLGESTIRGLAINGFTSGSAIEVFGGADTIRIEGNYLGTNAAGTAAVPNDSGVFANQGTVVVGGTTAAARNLISGNSNVAINMSVAPFTGILPTIQGNLVGTNAAGTAPIANRVGYSQAGCNGGSVRPVIGGATPAVRNVFSGNLDIGINYSNCGVGTSYDATGGLIQGNFVGTDVTGTLPLGNGQEGVFMAAGPGAIVGGTNPGEGNVIAFNGRAGVTVGQFGASQSRTRVLSNSIFSNGGLGIDIIPQPGVTPNDPGDVDPFTQNFPVITGVTSGGASTTITGTLNSEANKTYRVQFFRNDAADAASHGEGQTLIGERTDVTTDAGGNASFSITLPVTVSAVQWVTATATDPDGNTSEFSRLEADLSLVHTDAPDPAAVDQQVTHTLTVTNKAASVFPSGPATLRYTLAGDAVFVSASGGATPTGNVVTFNLGTITIGASVTRTVVVRYASVGARTSSADVTSVVIDPVTTDNTAPATTTVVVARYTISGNVRDRLDTGLPGVTMTLSGSLSATATTDADGNYAFTQLPAGGTYTVTPSRADFQFAPGSQTFPNLQKDEIASFFIATLGKFVRYFAEGAVSDFFDTRIALLNATGAATSAKVTFLTTQLQAVERTVPLNGVERVTIDPKTLGLANAEFATVVESDQPIVADRTMEWSDVAGPGSARTQALYGAHAETSIAAPQTVWYLAEGATIGGFELFYLLQNATATDAQVTVQYLLPAPAAPVVKTYTVPQRSRFNIWVNKADARLDDAEVSAVITSTNGVPLIVERAMYLNSGGKVFRAGHESAGVEAPALEWFLAEGATGAFFDLFILVANPNASAATIEARYLKPDGSVITRTYQAAAQSRFNIWVDLEPGLEDTAVSTTLRSTNGVPIIVERAMWWPIDSTRWYEGHNSAGALRTGTKWGLADGDLIATRETYVLVANTSATSGQAQVTLIFETGAPATRTFPLAATSRLNVDVRREFPEAVGRRFGVIVESLGATPAQIVVERAMYHEAGGLFWEAGTNVVGTRLR